MGGQAIRVLSQVLFYESSMEVTFVCRTRTLMHISNNPPVEMLACSTSSSRLQHAVFCGHTLAVESWSDDFTKDRTGMSTRASEPLAS